ncbi:MAG: isopentenyl phosphate kinase family protein [Anaerolineales bacterium]|nr:isopentenyl phosphate kinase family protein [Anaerolineales bacterium]
MLIFLKLGGSLITDKNTPRTPRLPVLNRLLSEVAAARAARPALQLVLGHGSGSFGHVEARRYGTRQGVRTLAEWHGFAEVQAVAGQLNRLVVDAARGAGVPVVNLPPSASAICRDGVIESMVTLPLQAALEQALVPLVFGDVAFDEERGGTIVSTEDVFGYLARALRPAQVLLAGREPGVLSHFPDGAILPHIRPDEAVSGAGGSAAVDVTGGMAAKVREMQALAAAVPGLTVRIFSGELPGLVQAALLGEAHPGTTIGQF